MATYRKNIAVGLTMLVALGLLGAMILMFGDAPAGLFRSRQVRVLFLAESAEGIVNGSPILYRGVNVGKVDKVELSNDSAGVAIHGSISHGNKLPANVVGTVQSSLIGGNAALSLRLNGEAPSGELQNGATVTVKQGGANLIPPEFADLAKRLSELSTRLQTTVDDFNNAKVINKLSSTIDTVQKTVSKVGDVADEARKLLADEKSREDIKQSIANFRAVSENAKVVVKNLETFSVKLNKVTEDADKLTTDATAVINKTGTRVDDLSKQLGQRLEQVATVLERFQSISDKLDKGDGTAGKLINDPKLYEALLGTSQELNLTVKDLRRLVEQWEQEGVSVKLGGKK